MPPGNLHLLKIAAEEAGKTAKQPPDFDIKALKSPAQGLIRSISGPIWGTLLYFPRVKCLTASSSVVIQLQRLPVAEGGGRRRQGGGGERPGRGPAGRELHDHGPVGELPPGGRLHPEEHLLRREAADAHRLERRHGRGLLPEGAAQAGRGEGLAGPERGEHTSASFTWWEEPTGSN